MSDDGTKAAKQIAYLVQLEGTLSQARYLIEQLKAFEHPTSVEATELNIWRESVDRVLALGRTRMHSFYKVIGEGG